MNPILNNTPTYSHAESVASTSTHQTSITPSSSSGSDALQLLRQPIPDHLGDYERETIMNERSDAFGQLLSDIDPRSPIDFSGIDFGDMNISRAVSSGLQQQWTDVGIERYLNGSDGNNLTSLITNNSQLTPDQQMQFMNGLVNSLRDSGVDLTIIPDQALIPLTDPLYSGDQNISNFVTDCQRNSSRQNVDAAEQQHLQDMKNWMDNAAGGSGTPVDGYNIPKISDYRNIESLKNDPNEYLAETANTLVRNRFKNLGVKSENKIKPNSPNSIARQQNASRLLSDAVADAYKNSKRPDYTSPMKAGVGNCHEMSGIAAQLVNNSGGYARQYCVDNIGTHTFSLVGKPPSGAKDNIHFSDYDCCWVLDPWSNIVCKANEYTEKFIEKMEKWTKDGKMLRSKDGWVPPNNPEWVKAVVEGNKCQYIYDYDSEPDKPQKEQPEKLSPPVKEMISQLDPQTESTTTEDMQKALKKAKELGPDTFLQWLDEADVAKRLAEGILSGQSITSCGLLLEDLANDLLDLLKEGAVPAKRICEALFPPQAKEFIMAAIPQLMLKPAGVRLTRLMEQLAQKDEATRSDLVDSMSKRSCVPSIERANSEKSDFYDRVASVYDRSVFPKITAARKGKLRDHLPLAFYKQSSDTLENGNLMSIKHRRIASFTKIRNDAQKLAQAMNSDELGHRTITPEMLRETQQKDNKNYEKQRNAIVNYRKIHIGNKISSDIIATVKQHMPEPEFVRNLNNLASEVLAFTNESNAIKEAEWESRQERIEVLQGSSDVATDGLFILAMAGAAIEATSSVEESMVRPAGRDINSMIGKGELKKAIDLNDLRNRLFDKFHGLWQETFKLLEGGVNDPYDGLLYTMLNIWETHLHLLALPNYALDLKEANEINSKMVQQLVRDGWLNSNNNPALDRFLAPTPTPTISAAPVVEKPVSKEPERQISAESASTASPPKKRTKTKKQALLA